MKTPLAHAAALTVIALALGACNRQDAAAPAEGEPQGRAETEMIRNVTIPGHDSKEIAKQVDATLNAADQRARETEAQTMETESAPE
jgi:hypothetical protein